APIDIAVELFCTEPPVGIEARTLTRIKDISGLVSAEGAANYLQAAYDIARRALNFEDVTKNPLVDVVQLAPPKPAPPTYEFAGIFDDVVLDTVDFSDSRIAYPKYNYLNGAELAYRSQFVATKDGRTIAPPVWIPELRGFALTESGSGTIVIRYTVPYRLF